MKAFINLIFYNFLFNFILKINTNNITVTNVWDANDDYGSEEDEHDDQYDDDYVLNKIMH
jgi:hypothetical protein